MSARIRRLFLVGLILATAFPLSHLNEAQATPFGSRLLIHRSEIVHARALSSGLHPLQEFSFIADSKLVHCRMNSRTQGEGFACEFQYGVKTLLLTSLEMERIDAKLATYVPGARVLLQGRVQLECLVQPARERGWICRVY